jgi:hypothetical protein
MSSFKKSFHFVFAFSTALMLCTPSFAQSAQDMSLLSEQEHQDFTRRLQHTTNSADRAKITAEMNRIVQERRLDLRQMQKHQDRAPEGAHMGEKRE